MSNDGLYLNGLDGLRSIAIFILVLGHCAQIDFVSVGGVALKSMPFPAGCLTILFVLSGFLAGFFMEKNNSDILYYYKKRAGRILPVYYLYIAGVLLIYWFAGKASKVFVPNLWYYIIPAGIIPFCSSNGILPLVHLWFVAVMVLFYLVFPWLSKLSDAKTKYVYLFVALLFFIFKLVLYVIAGKNTFIYRFLGSSQLDVLFFGVYFGILVHENNELFHWIGNQRCISAVSWLFFLLSGFYAKWVPAPIRNEFFMLIATVIILGLLSNKPFMKLEHRIWHFLGRISYSVYVIHIIILIGVSYVCNRFGLIVEVTLWTSLTIYIFCLSVSVFVAWLCNSYYEKPMYKIISTK